MEKLYVLVYLPGETTAVPAGIFTYDSYNQIGYFNYGRQYIANHRYPISPDLPIINEEISTSKFNGLFATFRDNLPDAFGRYMYWFLNGTSWKEHGYFGLLKIGGAGRTGNLDFRSSPDSPEPDGVPDFADLEIIVHEVERIIELGSATPEYKQLIANGVSSIGGMRVKCTIKMDDSLWIAKVPERRDDYDVIKVEAAMMHLARHAGITVPRVEVKQIGSKLVYLIERFDRQFDQSKNGFIRKGYVSALSLFGEHEDVPFYFGYPDFADMLRKHGDITGCHELFKRMLFNLAVKNIDDHSRNHGFLLDGYDLKLAPAFDLTPTETSNNKQWASYDFYLSVQLGKQGWVATFENALSETGRFGLTRSQAFEYADEVAVVLSGWRKVFDHYAIAEKDFRRFEVTFETAGDRLRL
jgi:serine/threonine-protein kinase HipA